MIDRTLKFQGPLEAAQRLAEIAMERTVTKVLKSGADIRTTVV